MRKPTADSLNLHLRLTASTDNSLFTHIRDFILFKKTRTHSRKSGKEN